MRAILIREPGGPEVLEFRDVAEPVVGRDDVLVRVRATGLNRADLLQRSGRYPAPPGVPPDVPGLEFAGEAIDVGDGVTSVRPGDRVMGIVGGAAMAERVALHERLCMPIPPSLDWAAAAAVPEAFLTAFDGLFTQGRLTAGERVWIDAAGSGVGTAACQLARIGGAIVLTGTRSPEKLGRLGGLGAHFEFDTRDSDWAARVLDATGGHGVQLVLDMIGAAAWGDHVRLLRPGGRWVLLGLMGGRKTELDLSPLITRRITLRGSVLRSRPLEEKISLVQEFIERGLPLLAGGAVRPVIDRVIPWTRVADAHRALERNETFGKIVLRVGEHTAG